MEAIVFTVALVLVLGFMTWRENLQARDHQTREKKYLAMISDLQNRITAKDLTGYQFLQNTQRPIKTEFNSLTDEEEARIVAKKRGLIERAAEMS